ncbi:MAG: Crp/Fnr family transcriptional regulator [Micavibrio sp.]
MNPISEVLERRFVTKGATIIKEGETGNSAFLIQSGKVRVFVEHEEQHIELAQLGPGQIFGEMALAFEEKRSATVEALEDTSLIVITRQTLEDKLRKSDPTIRALVPMLMKRIVQTNSAVLSRHSDVKTLLDVVKNIYDIILASLPRAQQQSFQNAVLPKLDQFLAAVKAFEDRYSEK